MIKLKIDPGYVRMAIDILTNNKSMRHTVYSNGVYILIEGDDLDTAGAALKRRWIPFKVQTFIPRVS